MADSMNFHTYAKLEKCLSFMVVEYNEHSYSRKTKYHTPLKRKRDRDTSTPTGETPRPVDKRQNLGTRWTEKEKHCLCCYISKFPPSMPVSNEYWRNCAAAISKEAGTSMTGASYRSFYNRTLLNAPVMTVSRQQSGHGESCNDDLSGISHLEDSPVPEDISAHQLPLKNTACQTDLVIPIVKNSPLPARDQQDTQVSNMGTGTLVHDILQDRLVAAHKPDTSRIQSSDAMDLIVSLFNCESIDILAKKYLVYKILNKAFGNYSCPK